MSARTGSEPWWSEERNELPKVFKDRAISHEVYADRPYVRWTTDDREPVRQAYHRLDQHQRAYMTRMAGKADGWVITRHKPPGMRLKPVCAEIRPDTPVETKPPTKHYHGEEPYDQERHGPYHKTLPDKDIHKPEDMSDHIKHPNDHKGTNSQEVHSHKNLAKYIFPPSRKCEIKWSRDHACMKPEKLEEHLENWHPDGDLDGEHEHARMVKDRDPEQSLARRLDMHPLAVEKFARAERVFFVIEGCLKADSVLTAGEAVFSVPSVTLWDTPELPRFAERWLQWRTVIIVPDADWHTNSMVVTQAKFCQTGLGKLGVDAVVAAPPTDGLTKKPKIKGIDDFLGIGGGKLADLEVINTHMQVDPREVFIGRGWRPNRLERNAEVAEALAKHADSNGRISASLRAVGRIMGVHPSRVSRAITDLSEYGDVTVKGDLTTRQNWFTKQQDWVNQPVIEVGRELRASETTFTLGELIADLQ